MPIPSGSHAVSSRRSRLRWLADVDLETRIAYGRALMSGHGMLYFPDSTCGEGPVEEKRTVDSTTPLHVGMIASTV